MYGAHNPYVLLKNPVNQFTHIWRNSNPAAGSNVGKPDRLRHPATGGARHAPEAATTASVLRLPATSGKNPA
jgi:hypothetical protein